MARQWVEEHLRVIPEDITVYLVENLTLPHPQVSLLLWKGCRERKKWVLLSSLRYITPYRYISHGECLDYAIRYVRTPYVLTLDSDAYIKKWETIEDMVRQAIEEHAAIVGHLIDYNITLPYIHPYCAVYETSFIRRVGMRERHYYPELPPEYMKYWKENFHDIYKEVRRSYLDIGQKAYLDALNEERKVINYPVFNGVVHLWGGTPFVLMWSWHGEVSLRVGRERGRPFHI